MTQTAKEAREAAAGVASVKDNEKLKHSAGGQTTRSDATDLGVPMLPGKPDEPQGPEDALGEGPKRGDYSERIPTTYHPHEAVPTGATKPGEPRAVVEAQRPRVEDIGDKPGKGGVSTASA